MGQATINRRASGRQRRLTPAARQLWVWTQRTSRFATLLTLSPLNTPGIKDSRQRYWICPYLNAYMQQGKGCWRDESGYRERDETVSVPRFIKWPIHSSLPFLRCLTGLSALCSPTCKTKSHCLKTENTSWPNASGTARGI